MQAASPRSGRPRAGSRAPGRPLRRCSRRRSADVISYPAETLTLAWAPVDYAATYEVKIATDPKLSSLVALEAIGAKPIPTGATALTPPTTLPAGTYYWGVTPIDAQGHKGATSKVSSFRWEWPSTTTAALTDLAGELEVDAYRFSWLPVPGASRYEVEINSSSDFGVGSKVCCTDATTGLSLTPVSNFANNSYYWRVRPIDTEGNAGQWTRGPDFTKSFDVTTPSIQGLHMRNHLWVETPTGGVTGSPIVTWNPVPGAHTYQVQVGKWTGGLFGVCEYGTFFGWDVLTATNAWTPLGHDWAGSYPYPPLNVSASTDGSKALENNVKYCVRVRAVADRDAAYGEVVGSFTDLQASPGEPWAFQFVNTVNDNAPLTTGACGLPRRLRLPDAADRHHDIPHARLHLEARQIGHPGSEELLGDRRTRPPVHEARRLRVHSDPGIRPAWKQQRVHLRGRADLLLLGGVPLAQR